MAHRIFIACDAHPATGGPHISRGLFVGRYFDHPASVVMCTARIGRRRSVCKSLILVPDELEKEGGDGECNLWV